MNTEVTDDDNGVALADQRPVEIVNVDTLELWYSRESFARAKNYRWAQNRTASENGC